MSRSLCFVQGWDKNPGKAFNFRLARDPGVFAINSHKPTHPWLECSGSNNLICFLSIILDFFPAFLPKRSMKYSTSRGMSATRSRNGGRSRGTTFSRYRRSSRNLPSAAKPVQITMSSRDHSNVDGYWLIAADALNFTFLQHLQQCDLNLGRQVANFVQKNCPAACRFEPSEASLGCTGESRLHPVSRRQLWHCGFVQNRRRNTVPQRSLGKRG
jgi:hypothetical protein